MPLYNFCAGRGCGGIDNWRDNSEVSYVDPSDQFQYSGDNPYTGALLDYLNNRYDGWFPGTNPAYALNGPLPIPDGKNNGKSNSGAAERYRDVKLLYEKDYLTSFNLITGILISLFIISKKT